MGALPVINLLLPACALPFALLWAAGRSPLAPTLERLRQGAIMLLILFLAAAELRQLAHGHCSRPGS